MYLADRWRKRRSTNIDIIDMRRDGHDMDRRASPTPGIRYTKTTASTEPQT